MSLYAAYACNEGSGTTILDYSGNGRNMTIAGTGNMWVTGHSPYPLAFLGGTSGTAGAQYNNGSADAALSGDVTVMCWAQSSNGATGQSFAAGLYSAAGTARLAMYSYRSLNATAASPELTVRNGAGGGPFSLGVNGSTADSAWHHIAAVYHSAGTVDLYLDGTAVVTAASVSSAIGTTVQFLGVGSLLPGSGANSAVQDFRVFSSALTSAVVTSYMNSPVIGAGAAVLSGSGSLTAAAVPAVPAAAALSGSGALAAQGLAVVPAAAALSGSGLIAAGAALNLASGAALSGSGSLTSAGLVTQPAAAVLAGTGTVTAAAAVQFTSGAALAGAGLLTASTAVQFASGAVLAGTGTVTAAALVTQPASAALTGTGSLAAAAAVAFALAAAPMSGTGALAAAALTAVPGAAALSGSGTLLAAASVAFPCAAPLSGQGTLAAAASVAVAAAAVLAGSGELTAAVQVIAPAPEPSVAWSARPAAPRWTCGPFQARWKVTMTLFKPVAAISLECVNVLWLSDLDGTSVDPTGQTSGEPALPVQMAFPQSSGNYSAPAEPSVWYTASWLLNGTGRGYVAQALVGPGGLVTLTAGLSFDVWSKVTASPEVPAKFAGTLPVY